VPVCERPALSTLRHAAQGYNSGCGLRFTAQCRYPERVKTFGTRRPCYDIKSSGGVEVVGEIEQIADNTGPVLDGSAFYGTAGVFVDTYERHTEADPVALLVQLLAGFGNAAGRSLHLVIDGARHAMVTFIVLIGQTSKGRKGTAEKRVRSVLERADPDWARNCIKGGVVSGEGVIYHLRDPIERAEPIKKGGRRTGEFETYVEDAGVADKRMLVIESEFSALLKACERTSNTASEVLRRAWDGDTLQTLAKNSPIRASNPHLSIVGHITKDELRRTLTSTAQANGFGNRFCWFSVHRSKELPLPSEPSEQEIAPIVSSIAEALDFARKGSQITLDSAAVKLWEALYHDLSVERPGLLGAITGRGEAQVMRLAAIYAALDSTAVITPDHLRAAAALWRFSVESVEAIFEDALGDPDADAILMAMRAQPVGMTRTEISALFARNLSAERIERALATLHGRGLAKFQQEKTAGRPVEKWFAKAQRR